MPYLIKCTNCKSDFVLVNLNVGTFHICPHCAKDAFISEYAEQISDSEARIRESGVKISKCLKCDYEIKSNAKYCKNCGTKLNTKIELEIIYCGKCGKEYDSGSLFCEMDGTELTIKKKSIDISINENGGGKKDPVQPKIKIDENDTIPFGWGNVYIFMAIFQGSIALLFSVIGGMQTEYFPNRGVGLLVSIFGLGSAYGIYIRKVWGLYFVYFSLIIQSLEGIYFISLGESFDLLRGFAAIIISILWYLYFQNRKGMFN